MLSIAYIFPGQGAQYVGMGQDFYQQYPQAREVFEQANRTLGFDLTGLIFRGSIEQLTEIINCQVAICVASVAALRVLELEKAKLDVKFTAGLSLGEYSALVASSALGFEETLRLVRTRAEFMQQAAKQNPGAMLSLIGLSLATVERICQQSNAEVANLNCPGQIVISGTLSAIEKAKELAQENKVSRIIPLKVGGAFHSSLMATASQNLGQFLQKVKISPSKIPIVSNVSAQAHSQPEEIKVNLACQVMSRTRWQDCIDLITASGVTHFLEIGPGKVLKGLLRKINSNLKVDNIGTVEELEAFKKEQLRCC